jgi:hypothetical protein
MSRWLSTPLGNSFAPLPFSRRPTVNRRAFLRAGAVAIGLPFLEGLPERSAWATDKSPVFSLFIVTANGVVPSKFFPNALGALTSASLGALPDKAVSALAPHAANLLFIKNLNFPASGPNGCSHAEGLCQTLTAAPPGSNGNQAYASGMSADVLIAQLVNPEGVEPLTLYAGNLRNGYITERISFRAAGMGQIRAADDNPYTLYAKLVGLLDAGGSGGTLDPEAAALLASRKSVNDYVREELNELKGLSALSADDKQRLQQHFDAIRDTEVTLGEMARACTEGGLTTSAIEALSGGLAFKMDGMIEDVAKLHLELVALAFACNFNRVATLQHGDGTDGTKYPVPSNADLGWTFHQLSHRTQSDSVTGVNPMAEAAHAEIDVLRMKTLAHGLDHFKARGLLDKSVVMWTNQIADGPSHSFRNVPHIIAGSGGGYLKQGAYVDAAGATNNQLFNALINAATRDQAPWTGNFGQGKGEGELSEVLA